MNDATYEANAVFVAAHWLPEPLAESIRPHAGCIMNLTAAALAEIQQDGEVDCSDGGVVQQPIMHAIALGYDWSHHTVRAPLHLEELATLSVLRHIEPIFNAPDEIEWPHSTLALGVYRDLSQLWHDSLDPDEVESVLDERSDMVERIEVRTDDELGLALWFDVGVAHDHFQRILLGKAAAERLPEPRPTLDPLAWLQVLDPDVFTEGGEVDAADQP